MIQINPTRRDSEPRSSLDIADRRYELSGNLSLYQELHFVEKIDQLLEAGLLAQDGPYRRIAVRIIELSPRRLSRALGVGTKLNRDPAFIGELIAHRRAQAEEFLTALRFERAWRRRDLDAVLALMSDDVRFTARKPFPSARAARGRDHLAAYLLEHLDAMQLDLNRKQVVGDAVTWSIAIGPAGDRAAAQIVLDAGAASSVTLGPQTLLHDAR